MPRPLLALLIVLAGVIVSLLVTQVPQGPPSLETSAPRGEPNAAVSGDGPQTRRPEGGSRTARAQAVQAAEHREAPQPEVHVSIEVNSPIQILGAGVRSEGWQVEIHVVHGEPDVEQRLRPKLCRFDPDHPFGLTDGWRLEASHRSAGTTSYSFAVKRAGAHWFSVGLGSVWHLDLPAGDTEFTVFTEGPWSGELCFVDALTGDPVEVDHVWLTAFERDVLSPPATPRTFGARHEPTGGCLKLAGLVGPNLVAVVRTRAGAVLDFRADLRDRSPIAVAVPPCVTLRLVAAPGAEPLSPQLGTSARLKVGSTTLRPAAVSFSQRAVECRFATHLDGQADWELVLEGSSSGPDAAIPIRTDADGTVTVAIR